MPSGSRRARLQDVHDLAMAMPHVTVEYGTGDNPVYQVGRRSFVFFRNPRPDATDPETGERFADVIVFWVPSEADKQALVCHQASPFFTTPHFDGHPSVLVTVQVGWGAGGIQGLPSNRSVSAVMAGTPFLRVVDR